MTFLYFAAIQTPSEKGLGSKFFPFGVDPFQRGGKNGFDRIASMKAPIFLNRPH